MKVGHAFVPGKREWEEGEVPAEVLDGAYLVEGYKGHRLEQDAEGEVFVVGESDGQEKGELRAEIDDEFEKQIGEAEGVVDVWM